MSSGWAIYTKLDVRSMVDLFRPLPTHYPALFGFYSSNKILTTDLIYLEECAHYIDDPTEVYKAQ